jgi:glycine hydroxymethyltransferase
LDFAAFAAIAKEVDCPLLVDMAHFAGLVAGGAHPSPIAHADYVTTTTHKTLRGPRGGMILCREAHARKVNSKIFPGIQGGPLEHVIAAKAVAFGEALRPEFRTYSAQIVKNAQALAQTLMAEGLRLVTNGTDNHLMLVDLTALDITGKEAEESLDRAGITVNKNTVPRETRSPFVTSGIRIGTPALTTRGMKEAEMQQIGKWIATVVRDFKNETLLQKMKSSVHDLCQKFPIYRV